MLDDDELINFLKNIKYDFIFIEEFKLIFIDFFKEINSSEFFYGLLLFNEKYIKIPNITGCNIIEPKNVNLNSIVTKYDRKIKIKSTLL